MVEPLEKRHKHMGSFGLGGVGGGAVPFLPEKYHFKNTTLRYVTCFKIRLGGGSLYGNQQHVGLIADEQRLR